MGKLIFSGPSGYGSANSDLWLPYTQLLDFHAFPSNSKANFASLTHINMRSSSQSRTGAKRKTTVTLPSLHDITDPAERVKLRTLRLKLHAQPSNYSTPVGELSPEQHERLTSLGNRIQTEREYVEHGRERIPTGLQRKRIVGQVEQLRRLRSHEAITVEQFAAAQAFQACVARATMSVGSLTMSYEPRFIDAPPKPELFAAERGVARQTKVKQVYRAMSAYHHPVLDWLKAEVIFGQPYSIAAKKLWPDLTERYAQSLFRRRLKETLDLLIDVFWNKLSKDSGFAENIA